MSSSDKPAERPAGIQTMDRELYESVRLAVLRLETDGCVRRGKAMPEQHTGADRERIRAVLEAKRLKGVVAVARRGSSRR
jgi:hypothetical protein